MIRDHEKFWAFLLLVVAVVGLALVGILAAASEAQLRLLEKVSDGLLVVLGAAGMALFRHSQTEQGLVETNRTLAEKAPPPTVPLGEITPGFTNHPDPWRK